MDHKNKGNGNGKKETRNDMDQRGMTKGKLPLKDEPYDLQTMLSQLGKKSCFFDQIDNCNRVPGLIQNQLLNLADGCIEIRGKKIQFGCFFEKRRQFHFKICLT